jgi:hypothetical protein
MTYHLLGPSVPGDIHLVGVAMSSEILDNLGLRFPIGQVRIGSAAHESVARELLPADIDEVL